MYFSLPCQPLFLNCFIVCVVFRSPWFVFFSHSFNTFDKHLFTGISMVICKISWSIRSWLSDYISFSFYKSYCRRDIYWILVAFMIAASALIKVSRLYGLYRHLYTQLMYWHFAVILYNHVNLLNKRFWILNPESSDECHNTSLMMPHCGWRLVTRCCQAANYVDRDGTIWCH